MKVLLLRPNPTNIAPFTMENPLALIVLIQPTGLTKVLSKQRPTAHTVGLRWLDALTRPAPHFRDLVPIYLMSSFGVLLFFVFKHIMTDTAREKLLATKTLYVHSTVVVCTSRHFYLGLA